MKNSYQNAKMYAGMTSVTKILRWYLACLAISAITPLVSKKMDSILNENVHIFIPIMILSLVVCILISFIVGRNKKSLQIEYFKNTIAKKESEALNLAFKNPGASKEKSEVAERGKAMLKEHYNIDY